MNTPDFIKRIIDDAFREKLSVVNTATRIMNAANVSESDAYTMLLNYACLGK